MKVNGTIIERMEKEFFGILLEIFILDNLLRIKHMDMVLIFMSMAVDTKVNGFTIFRRDMVRKYGRMDPGLSAHIKRV